MIAGLFCATLIALSVSACACGIVAASRVDRAAPAMDDFHITELRVLFGRLGKGLASIADRRFGGIMRFDEAQARR